MHVLEDEIVFCRLWMSWSCLPSVLVLLQMEIITSLDQVPRVGLIVYFYIIISGLDGVLYYMLGQWHISSYFFLEKSDCISNLSGFKIVNLILLCHVTAEKSISSVPSEQAFLHRLLDRGATESSYTTNSSNGSVDKTGMSTRNASTYKSLKHLVQAIDCERVRNDDLAATLRNCLANNGKTGLLAFHLYFLICGIWWH